MDSVKMALRVFEAVAEKGEAGLGELVHAIGAPKSTVQRGLTTLHEAGWLSPIDSGSRRRWTPSLRLATIARGGDALTALRQAAIPILRELRDTTRETIHLTARDGDRVVLVERCDSPQVLRTGWPLGSSSPLHVGANGKAVLAASGERELARYLGRELEAWTEHTIVDPDQLRTELSRIRDRGYAVSDRELDSGVRAVAAPIFGPDGDAIAALSISCPATRLPDDLIGKYGASVVAAAAAISKDRKG